MSSHKGIMFEIKLLQHHGKHLKTTTYIQFLSHSHTSSYQPEVFRAQHLSVVHDFTLVRRHLQGGQHVVHSGQVGGRTGRHVVELPLEDVEAWPPRDMGALKKEEIHEFIIQMSETELMQNFKKP